MSRNSVGQENINKVHLLTLATKGVGLDIMHRYVSGTLRTAGPVSRPTVGLRIGGLSALEGKRQQIQGVPTPTVAPTLPRHPGKMIPPPP